MQSNETRISGNGSQANKQSAQLQAQVCAPRRGVARRMAGALAGVAFAGALVLAAPHAAQAQVAFGVQVGGYSGYAAPAYGYGYSDPYAVQAWLQRRAYEEHERWEAERAAQWQREGWNREAQREHWDRRDGFRGEDRGGDRRWDHARGW